MSSTESFSWADFADDEEAEVQPLTDVQKQLSDEIKSMRESKRKFDDMKSCEFYVCIVFSGKKDKEEWLNKMGLDPHDTYIDGYKLSGMKPSNELKMMKK